MTKISGSTFYFKKVFPSVWFGFLGFFLLVGASSGHAPPFFFIVPVVMAIFGYTFFKKMLWNLADEVVDAGDHLIFRKGDKEQRVRLEDIINISYMHMSSPEIVTLHVRSPGPLGTELAFNLPARLRLFSKSPMVAKLIERVDRARRA